MQEKENKNVKDKSGLKDDGQRKNWQKKDGIKKGERRKK